MSTVLFRPEQKHACMIGCKRITVTQEEADARNAEDHYLPAIAGTFIVDDLELRALPGGSVVECEVCGKVWVKNPVEWQHNARSAHMVDNSWRPEKRRERHKRLRKAAS